LWVTDHVVGLQVSEEEEEAGLDLGELAEIGYARLESATAPAAGLAAVADGQAEPARADGEP
jgi:hypothetical protein